MKDMVTFTPAHLPELVKAIAYKPGWEFSLVVRHEPVSPPTETTMAVYAGGLTFEVVSDTADSFDFTKRIRVRHGFLVPLATYNRDVWAAWLFDRIRDVETHEAGEFFRIDGVREFAPHHGNGEDPYRVWHVSDWATADKSSGQD